MIKYDRKWFKMSKLWHFKVLATEPLFWVRVPADAPRNRKIVLRFFIDFNRDENPRAPENTLVFWEKGANERQ